MTNTNPFDQAKKAMEQLGPLTDEQAQTLLSGGYLPALTEAIRNCRLPERELFRRFVKDPTVFREFHEIDLDVAPYEPEGLTAVEHRKGGQFIWDPSKVRLYLSPNQIGDKTIKGSVLCEELAGLPVFNANLLDYLLLYQHLIPKDWQNDESGKPRYIHFPGTKYRGTGGGLYVRCLYFGGGHWDWYYGWLDSGWLCHCPSALRAD